MNWTKWTAHRGFPQPALRCRLVITEAAREDPVWRQTWVDRASNRPALITSGLTSVDSLTVAPLTAEGAIAIRSSRSAAANPKVQAILLPFLPHWPGLLANTQYYAVVICALHRLPSLARQWRRQERGRCGE